jgi:hypothetical protein
VDEAFFNLAREIRERQRVRPSLNLTFLSGFGIHAPFIFIFQEPVIPAKNNEPVGSDRFFLRLWSRLCHFLAWGPNRTSQGP